MPTPPMYMEVVEERVVTLGEKFIDESFGRTIVSVETLSDRLVISA